MRRVYKSVRKCLGTSSPLRLSSTILATSAALASVAGVARAQDLYSVDISVGGGEPEQVSTYSTFEGFVDSLIGGDSIYNDPGLFGDSVYDPTVATTFIGDLRGLEIVLEFPDTGEGVQLVVPSIDLVIEYDQLGSRDLNVQELEDHLVENRRGDLTKILQALMGETPFDPVAGNPNSLQSKMVEADFGMGTGIGPGPSYTGSSAAAGAGGDGSVGGDGGASELEDDSPSLVGIGARLGRFTAQGVDTTVLDLPLSYTIPLADPRWAVMFDMPLTYVETGNTQSYSASLGVGVRVPVFDNWALTPSVRVGLTGSEDLGSAATLYGASLSSSARFDLAGLDVEVGNMVSYVASTPLDIDVDGYTFDYDVGNAITRNGVGVTGDMSFELFNQPVVWEFNAVNTQIFGDDIYIDNYTDIALSIGTQQSSNGITFDSLRLGVTYTFSNKDYEGFRVNFGYQF